MMFIAEDVYYKPEELRFRKLVQDLRQTANQNKSPMKHARVVNSHKYELLNEENPQQTPPQVLKFCRKETGDDRPTVIHNGTNDLAVIEVMIQRAKYLKGKTNDKQADRKLKYAINQLTYAKNNIEEAVYS